MLFQMKCPQCGADLIFDDSKEYMFCNFCGAKIANIEERRTININKTVSGEVTYKRDTSNDPNLLISYSTVETALTMVSVIKETRDKWIYTNGQSMSYRLSPGRYELIIQVGKRKWSRFVFIPSDNTPVQVQVVFTGSTKILIQQPQQGVKEFQAKQAAAQQSATNGITRSNTASTVSAAPRIPIYKRWWFWLIVAVGTLQMIGIISAVLQSR